MVVHIIIGGVSQCEVFAGVCYIADYLCQQLPDFCYERIEKPVAEWRDWLCKINMVHNWHHLDSPIVWKELMIKGSKAFYIGGASDFLEYIHSYYNFDFFMGSHGDKLSDLVKNFSQFKKKLKEEVTSSKDSGKLPVSNLDKKNEFILCLYGASCPVASTVISRLLDMSTDYWVGSVSRIYLYDEHCSQNFLLGVENQCSFIETQYSGKVVRVADKIGTALTVSDVLIIFDHVPFDPQKSVGEWLYANMQLMQNLATMINASASRAMYIILANLGPACFNATVLLHSVTRNIKNIVVATSDLGLEVLDTLSEVCDLPIRNMFCPPVWGFVGINHLVDVGSTVHRYNSFEPYNRYLKVTNSTLPVGKIVPEIRTMEYMTHFDDTIWVKLAEKQKIYSENPKDVHNVMSVRLNKAVAILNLIRVWLIEPTTNDTVVALGIRCNGSFGLTFDGNFSQPCSLHGREWKPAEEFGMPKDNYVKLPYLQYIAEMMMTIERSAMPPIIKWTPCKCKKILKKKKGAWW